MIPNEVKADRLLLILGAVLYTVWGFIYYYCVQLVVDPYIPRTFLILLMIALIISSYFKVVQSRLTFCIYVLIYLVTLHQSVLPFLNDFKAEFIIVYLAVTVFLKSYFKSTTHLIIYSVFTIIINTLLIYTYSSVSNTNINILYLALITLDIFIVPIFIFKLNNDKRMTRLSSEYEDLIENISDAILIDDVKGKIVFANKQLLKLFGVEDMKLEELSYDNFVTKEFLKTIQTNHIKRMNGEEVPDTFECIGFHKSGDTLFLEAKIKTLVKDGKISGSQAIIRDITERTKTFELQKQKEVAENISKLKDEFFSKISHELRTPLNGINGFTDLLLNEELSPRQQKYIETIKYSNDNLIVLVNDLLDISQIETGKIKLKIARFEFKKLISNTLSSLQFEADKKNIKLKFVFDETIPQFLEGDLLRITQIFNNLIVNAIKYSDFHKTIKIKIKLLADLDHQILLRMSFIDQGIGIPSSKLEQIFEPFIQVETNHSDNIGFGLGLSIVKKMVSIMGGTIGVKSKPSFGSVFEVVLPLEKSYLNGQEQQLNGKNPEISPVKLNGLKILLGEDNKINQLLVKTILENEGVQVEIANNGIEIIDLNKNIKFDLIITDLMMPKMGGIEVITYFKKFEANRINKIPIIVVTADLNQNITDHLHELGVKHIIRKPFDKNELLLEIQNCMNNIQKSDSTFEIINLDYLNSFTENNLDLNNKLIILFLEMLHETSHTIDESLVQNSSVDLLKILHKIKPSIKLFGISSNIIDNIESIQILLNSNNQVSDIIPFISKLKLELKSIEDEINQL